MKSKIPTPMETRKNKDRDRNIEVGFKHSNPTAVVLQAFIEIADAKHGLTARRVITFLKSNYRIAGDPKASGRNIGKVLRSAVEFGILQKRGTKYFLCNNS